LVGAFWGALNSTTTNLTVARDHIVVLLLELLRLRMGLPRQGGRSSRKAAVCR